MPVLALNETLALSASWPAPQTATAGEAISAKVQEIHSFFSALVSGL
jgi:hypothetical protein